jgi:hypothetical protein
MDMITEMTNVLETMDPAVVEAAGVGMNLFLTAVISAVVYLIAHYLVCAIGYSQMYRKAGEAPWKAFIPVYNTYNNYKISWNGKLFFLSAALYILMTAFANSTMLAVQLAVMAASIALIVVTVKQNVKMAKRFGKGAGTGIALIFFPGITSLILGLGKAEFQGEMIENN